MERLTVNFGGPTIREEILEGRNCLVAPSAILEEGVWAGSNGPLFYPDDELSESVPAWNHKPLVVLHPEDEEGNPLSGCLPEVINRVKCGVVLNTVMDDKLRTEAWFDIERTNEIDKRIIPKLRKGELIECSTGVYTTNEKKSGVFNGKEYDAIARKLKPDHLAVLPDRVGAYSCTDGGGILQLNEKCRRLPESVQAVLSCSVLNQIKNIGAEYVNNEISFGAIQAQLCDLLREKYGEPGKYWGGYIVEVFSNSVVFAMDMPEATMYKLDYTVKDGVVSLTGEETEVIRQVEYKGVESGSYVGNSERQLVLHEREDVMAKKFDKVAHINSLIGNGYEESDREALGGIPDSLLQKILPTPAPEGETEEEEVPETKPVGNAKKKAPEPEKKHPTFEELLRNASPEDREQWKEGQRALKREKDALIATITANENNEFEEDYLRKECSISLLRNMAKLAKKSSPDDDDDDEGAMYIGNAGIKKPTNNKKVEEPTEFLDLPVMFPPKEGSAA